MDTLLSGGDHALDGRGLPIRLEGGAPELIQRALIRLSVQKGSFRLDPGLGSELHRLPGVRSDIRDRAALSYVREALSPMPQVSVLSAACSPPEPGGLRVAVTIALEAQTYQLEVNVST